MMMMKRSMLGARVDWTHGTSSQFGLLKSVFELF